MKRLLQQVPILIAAFLLIAGASAATVVHRTGAPAGATTTVSVISTTGLIGYWPLDANTISSITAADKSGNDITATIVGAHGSAEGKIGQGISLDGAGFINLPVRRTFDALTVSLWFNASLLAGDNPRLIANAHTDDSNLGFQLELNDGGTSGFFDVGNGSAEGRATWTGAALEIGRWYHYVGTYDGADVRTYINGVQVADEPFAGGAVAQALNDIAVGYNPAYGEDFFHGTVDDIRVYDRALSANEIGTLYKNQRTTVNALQNTKITDGLVAHWSFDGADTTWSDATDGLAHDTSGSGYDGTLSGFSQKYSVTPGTLGQALLFNGSNSYIATSYTVPVQNNATSFTWSTWAKLDAGNAPNAVILGFRQGSAWIKLTPTKFEYADGTTNNIVSPPVGQWVNITIVKDHLVTTYYLDGVQDTTSADARSTDSGTFYIGEDPDFPDDGTFRGALDDVRVYDRALSPDEVRALYLLGK